MSPVGSAPAGCSSSPRRITSPATVDRGIPALALLDGSGRPLGSVTGPQLATLRQSGDPATLVAALDRLARTGALH